MAGDHREGSWELSASVGVVGVGKLVSGTGSTEIMPGGLLRVGYNLNEMWNLSVGSSFGFGKSAVTNLTAYAFPFAAVTWTPDINKRTSPFVTAGAGLLWRKNPSENAAGVQVGAGVRHMVGENLALRVEGALQYLPKFAGISTTTGAGLATVGLSYFAGAKKVLTTVRVSPAIATLTSLRQTQQLAAAAVDQRGRPMTGKVFGWRSSNPSVATVSPAGLVTAVGDGSATISATSEGIAGSANVTVSRTAVTVAVTPTTATLSALRATQQLAATANDASNSPISGATFTWNSSAPSVASVSPSGLVTSVGNGTARITATSGGTSGTATVTVAQATGSVVVTPATANLTAAGGTSQLAAQALDANGSPIAGKAFTWSSDAPNVATVSPAGLVTGVANGVAHISATADGKSGAATVSLIIAARGAPPVELPAVNATMVMRNVTFRANRAVLTPAARTDLDKVAIAIQATPNSRWEIAGYTSSVGRAAVNQRLSQQRADAVKAYLVSKGVSAASLTAVGYGSRNPIANNRTAAGRRQNMRVEIKRLQ